MNCLWAGQLVSGTWASAAGGRIAWIDAAIALAGGIAAIALAAALIRHRTANRTAANLLRELEMQKSALDQHAIVVVTDPKGIITYANDKFCEISRYPRDELLGKTHRVVNSGRHPREFFVEMWRTITRGRTWKGEICNRAKDGGLYWVETTIVPFVDERGVIERYVAIRTDVSALKAAEAMLRSKAAELERSNQELEEFAHTVSHDLKSPLVTIRGYAGLLSAEIRELQREDAIHHVDDIIRATDRMRASIDDLLQLGRVGRMEQRPEPIDPGELAREVIDELHAQIAESGPTIAVEPAMPRVLADRTHLRLVLHNLLTNAIKYGRPGSGSQHIQIGARSSGDEVRIFVSDNGPGIAPELHETIFQLFQRVEDDDRGTGVGLAIVRRIVESLGGRAWVQSQPGGGATFFVALPAAKPRVESPAVQTSRL